MISPRLRTPLCTRLNIEWPLILAPMAGPSTPELTAAVCNAGGLGSLAGAYLPPETLRAQIERTRQLTTRPFAVNLFAPCPDPNVPAGHVESAVEATRRFRDLLGLPAPTLRAPYQQPFEKQFEVVLESKPAVFSFVFGTLDKQMIDACKQRGIYTIGAATSVEDALTLQEIGVDAVVAQGMEAGGHRALLSAEQEDPLIGVFPLTRQMSRALQIPVIATGGIMDGAGIAAALILGAQAVQFGTAFLLCNEAVTPAPYREMLRKASSSLAKTRLTRAFSGRWARGIENQFMMEMEDEKAKKSILPFPTQNAFTQDLRKAAAQRGHPELLSLWAGQGVRQIREMKAAELAQVLLNEASAALQ